MLTILDQTPLIGNIIPLVMPVWFYISTLMLTSGDLIMPVTAAYPHGLRVYFRASSNAAVDPAYAPLIDLKQAVANMR